MRQITEVRCSGLSRIMTCAGVLAFENLPEQEEGQPAREGTAAGRHFQYLLEGVPEDQIPVQHENGIAYDEDIKYYTRELAQQVLEKAQSKVLCEQRIDWTTRSGIIVRGSYDASYVRDGKLYIDDLKYGWRIVDVKENWQVLGYAIGEVIRRQVPFDRIVMRILQPRPHHEDGPVREWEISYQQLLEYKEQIEQRMDLIASGNRQLVTSEKCKYCPAAASACTAFNRAFYSGVDYILNHFQQDELTEKEIAYQMDLINRISAVLEIKQDSLTQLAIHRIKNGALIPGYMTQENYGHRKWKTMISPKVIEALTGKNIIKQEMISPAQAEKMGVAKHLIEKYTDRYFVGLKLVPKDANALGAKIFGKDPNKT